MKQAFWYTFQTAIVVWVVYVDRMSPEPKLGVALLLGVGWAISLTILLHLIGNGIRRLLVLVLPSRIEQGHSVAVKDRLPVVPLHFPRSKVRR